MIDLKKAEKVVKKAILKAGKYIQVQQKNVKILKHKSLEDVLTNIDLQSQQLIISQLKTAFPDHGFIAEENNLKEVKDFTWTIDPLDGTKYYVKGLPNYSVAISLFHQNDPIIGAIYQPVSNQLYIGNTRDGAYCNNKQINVSNVSKLKQATLYATLPNIGLNKIQFDKTYCNLEKLFKNAYRVRYLGEAISLAWVAHGAFEAFINIPGDEYTWDVGPGFALINAAGGKISDLKGDPIKNFDLSKGIIASNGKIHDQLLQLINS